MANIRKSFNFRNGVQIDDDNFIVNSNGLVGIGTSIPSEILDVRGGNIKCDSTIISNSLIINGIGTVTNLSSPTINSGITSITSGIITATVGVITYYGDGGQLLNLPTSQWLDVDVGLGFTSIYSQGFVGISTNDPRFVFQVGGGFNDIATAPNGFISGVGINSTGDIVSTGNVTAGNFIGNGSLITQIDASNLSSGTLDNNRLSTNVDVAGTITANNFVGFGSEITQINASNISLGTLDNARLPQDFNISSGIITSLNSSFIGIGTFSGSEDITIYDEFSTTSIRLTSINDRSSIIFGRNLNSLSQNGVIRFGNNDNVYAGTIPESLDILNYGDGNVNYYINVGSATSSNFNWIKGYNNFLMTLTQDGKLGIGKTNPLSNLDVVGTSSITSDLYVGQNLTVQNNFSILSGTFNSSTILGTKVGVATNLISSSYDFQVGADPTLVDGGTAIKSGNVYIREDIKQVRDISSSGIITATSFVGSFSGDGSLITNIDANNITSGTLNNIDINTGIVTANTNFVGIGSLITNIDADNITSGTLNNLRLPSDITITGNLSANSISADTSLIVNGTFSSDNLSIGNTISSTNVEIGNSLRIQSSTITTGLGTFDASPGTPEIIDEFSILVDQFKSIEYTLHLENSSNIQVQKVLATQNGTNAYSTGYGITFNPNKIATPSTIISSDDFRLRVTPESGISGLTTYSFIRQSLS